MRRQLGRDKLPAEFFSEILLHLSLFLGYPPFLEGLEVLTHLSKRRLQRASLRTVTRKASSRGKTLFASVYGNQASSVLQNLERLHPGLASHILKEPYGRIMSRGVIDLSEREILNVVVLFIQGYEKQLYSHVRGALRAGVTRQALIDVFQYAASLSRLNPGNVIHIVERIDRRGSSVPF